ncbi:MAG: 5-oxoprolinase subunit PxpB [Anaerolineae bacterium]
MISYPRILPVGEAAFTVEFGDRVDPALVARVHALDAMLTSAPPRGFVEAVPTYRALLVRYEPHLTDAAALRADLAARLDVLDEVPQPEGRLVEIPVRYGGEHGPDLETVAEYHQLTSTEVVRLHTAPTYRVAMLGFAPGFAYLLGLDPRLATPRLSVPRTRVPAGSVGIAGEQTGVYALSTPGGWRVLGHTELPLFDSEREDPFTLRAGDRVRFLEA